MRIVHIRSSRSMVVLSRDGPGSKWPSVHKVYEQLPEKAEERTKLTD